MALADNRDALYKDYFEEYVSEFCRLCSNGEVTITALSPVLELFKESQLLKYLMADPTNDAAKTCVKDYIASHRNVPRDFLAKFLSIIAVRVNVVPTSIGYINQSYTAKVIYNNVVPTSKLTNITIQTRQDELRAESTHVIEYVKTRRAAPQSIKIKMTEDTLPMCINAMGDLHRTITEGNRANGREMNSYIKTSAK